MLLKCVGLVMLMSACAMFGISLSRDYIARINNLSQINKMLLLLKGEIKYNNSGINEAVRKVSLQTDNIIGVFLKKVSEKFENGKVTLKEAWNYGADEYLKNQSKLSEKDILILKELGANLGVTDRETQINNITKCMDVIDMTIQELNETRGEKCRLYKTLGVMAGVFVAVVLI